MTDTVLDRLRDIVLFVTGLVAIGALILAAFEGFSQRVTSAAFLGTLGVVCTFMVFMPKLEVFKVWGVEARLNKTLDRAEEILGKLRRLSLISARSSYMTMAWSNRMDGPSVRDKQAILDEVDRQLSELNVTLEERAVAVGPYINLLGWDFYQMYVRTLERYVQSKYEDVARKLNHGEADFALRQKIDAWSTAQNNWRQRIFKDGLFARAQAGDLEGLLVDAFPKDLLDDGETQAVDRYRSEIVRLFKGCVQKGGFTKEAAEYYDKFSDLGGYDKKIIELFNYNPSQLR